MRKLSSSGMGSTEFPAPRRCLQRDQPYQLHSTDRFAHGVHNDQLHRGKLRQQPWQTSPAAPASATPPVLSLVEDCSCPDASSSKLFTHNPDLRFSKPGISQVRRAISPSTRTGNRPRRGCGFFCSVAASSVTSSSRRWVGISYGADCTTVAEISTRIET